MHANFDVGCNGIRELAERARDPQLSEAVGRQLLLEVACEYKQRSRSGDKCIGT